MGPKTWIYPLPVTLVGADIDGKPNFMTAAWCSIANGIPPMISVAIRHRRYTNKGIRQNGVFSINIPSIDMVTESDYCGLVSGSEVNKVEVCQFSVFYGKLENAPLIEECPINLECSVLHTLGLDSHDLVIGKVEETHITEACLTDGIPDITKMKPIVYATGSHQYRTFGDFVAKAHSTGQKLKDGEPDQRLSLGR